MNWIKVITIIATTGIFTAILMIWSGREGKAFRKSISKAP